MTIDKQALREEFRLMQAHYSDPADRARQVIYIAAEALLDELDKKQQYIKLRDQENEDIALTVGKLRVELEHYKSREERVTKLVLDNSTSWDALYKKLESSEKRIAELVNDEVRQRLANAEHQLHMAELAKCNLRASRKAQFRKRKAAERRIAELEAREIKPAKGEVLVVVSGFTGCGKSAIAGEIEIAMKAIGVPVQWTNGDAEKHMTGADWLTAIEMYKPTVRIVEVNVPRAAGIKVEGE
ncbi:ead/Ea22-like family protein [Salmonella enterica]|nr:ead/Ea22-like family protein [Salmonella enterica]EFO7381357.1 ead/Ea22-like family protein [Salmonella enterica]